MVVKGSSLLLAHIAPDRDGGTYKYYLTNLGRRVILMGLKIKNLYVIPQLASSSTV
jgi:hypothetical protein